MLQIQHKWLSPETHWAQVFAVWLSPKSHLEQRLLGFLETFVADLGLDKYASKGQEKVTIRLWLRGDQTAAIQISKNPVGVEWLLLGVWRLGLGWPITCPTLLLTVLPQSVCTTTGQTHGRPHLSEHVFLLV